MLVQGMQDNSSSNADERKCALEGDECAGHALVLGALLLLQDEPAQLVHAVPVELHMQRTWAGCNDRQTCALAELAQWQTHTAT